MTTFLFLALAMSAQRQPTAPKNLAGAEFPCNYERMTPNTITAKFLDTVGDVTFLTGDVQIRSAKILVHADGRRHQGECELGGNVTVTFTTAKPASK